MAKFDLLTFTLTSSSEIMKMNLQQYLKQYCLIGHMTRIGVVALCISLPSGGHQEVMQESNLPSGAESWVFYRNQEPKLSAFHTSCLWFILDV